jgi:hypothetical protein
VRRSVVRPLRHLATATDAWRGRFFLLAAPPFNIQLTGISFSGALHRKKYRLNKEWET